MSKQSEKDITSKNHNWHIKALKTVGIVILSIVLLITLISLLAGPIARGYVNKHGRDLLGRDTRVDHIRTNLWNGHVSVEGLKVKESDGESLFLNIDTLDVSLRLRALLAHSIHVRHITLAGVNATIEQQGSVFNFSDIIDHFASHEADTTGDEPSKPWGMGIYDIRLSHWKLHYADLSVGSQFHLEDMNLEIPGVYLDGRQNTEAGLALLLADGGTLNTTLDYNMESQDFTIDLQLRDFDLANIEAYLTHSLRLSKVDGIAQAHIQASGNLSSVLAAKISGNVAIDHVDVKDHLKKTLLLVEHLGIDAHQVVLARNLYRVDEVAVNGLRTRFDLYADGNNFSRLLLPASPQEHPDTVSNPSGSSESKPMQLSVAKFRVNDAQVVLADHTLADPFSYTISHLNIASDHVTLSGQNSATVTASLPRNGKLDVRWKGTLQPIGRMQDLQLNLTGLRLDDLSPYMVTYLAYPFTDGLFSFRSHNTIVNNMLDGKNTIDIYRPEVGSRRKDIDSAMHVPLRLALNLLKDKDGKILIEVPVSGNIQSPQFSYMGAVWSTLRGLLLKVATSPLRGVAHMLGIDADGLDFVAFDAAQTSDFTSEQLYKLEKLSVIAKADSSLTIVMQQKLPATDSLSLSNAALRNTALRKHMSELGVLEQQLTIETNADAKAKQCGYDVKVSAGSTLQ